MRQLPRFEANLGVLESQNLANIALKYNGRKVVLKMNTHDFYIMGLSTIIARSRNSEDNDAARLRGSIAIGMRLNYPPLVVLRISKEIIQNAFGKLAEMEQGNKMAYDVAIICLVFCEGSRFSWGDRTFRRCVLSKGNFVIVEEWLSDMIKDWSILTRLARECDEENFELSEFERMIIKTHDYAFFDLVGPHHRRSQARIAKLLIKVAHVPRNNP